MSDIKTQMALRALNSLEDFARDAIIGKAQKESDRELAMAEFLFKNEYQMQQDNIAEIKQLGLELSPEYQTDNLEYFADNAGDSNYMQLLGGMTRQSRDKRQMMDVAINDYSRGINVAKNLRASKAFESPGEKGIDLLTASQEEIANLDFSQLSEEDRKNVNFMTGFGDTKDVAVQANLKQLDYSLQQGSMALSQLQIDNNIKNLGIANEFYGNELGAGGKIMLNSLIIPETSFGGWQEEGIKYDLSSLIGIDLLKNEANKTTQSTYKKEYGKYEKIMAYLKDNFPNIVVANIQDALLTFMGTNSIKGSDNAYRGFGKLASRVKEAYSNLDRMESELINNNVELQNYQIGQFPDEVVDHLMNSNEEYKLAKETIRAYESLGLNLPDYPVGTLNSLADITKDEIFLDMKEQEIYKDVMFGDMDFTTPGLPNSHTVKNIEQNEEIDRLFQESMVPGVYNDDVTTLNFNADIPRDNTLQELVNDIDSGTIQIETETTQKFTSADDIEGIRANTKIEDKESFVSELLDSENFNQGQFINEDLSNILSQYISEGNKSASKAMKVLEAYAKVEQSKHNYLNSGQEVPRFIWDRIGGLSEELSKQIDSMNVLEGSELWYRTYGIKPRSIFYQP